MFDGITLHAEYLDNGVGGVIAANATEVRLYTEDGTFVAVWERVERDGPIAFTTWEVSTSDVMDDKVREDMSGYHDVSDAVNAAVEWFRSNAGEPVELDS